MLFVIVGFYGAVFLYLPNIFYGFFLVGIIVVLRRSRGEEVYILFYTFFLFASIAFAIALYLHSELVIDVRTFRLSDLSSLDNRTTYLDILRWIIEMTTDTKGE